MFYSTVGACVRRTLNQRPLAAPGNRVPDAGHPKAVDPDVRARGDDDPGVTAPANDDIVQTGLPHAVGPHVRARGNHRSRHTYRWIVADTDPGPQVVQATALHQQNIPSRPV